MALGRRLVIIGHLGFETVQTPYAQRPSPGGSAYYTALGAALAGGDVSLVSTVGDDFPLDSVRELGIDVSYVRYVHVATNLPQTQSELIERFRVVAPRSTVTADCFDQFVLSYPIATCRVVATADLVFANLVVWEMIQRMCGTITTPMVVKKGERGADYRSAEETVTTIAPAVQVIDPTGAGDAFAGAYLAHRARGADLAFALAAACRMGAAAVQ